jgi:glycosyltransferase involved in cell wall biosynthesis
MSTNKKILLFQRIIPAYRLPVFKQLYERLGIIVCHSESKKGSSLSSIVDHEFPTEKLKRFFYNNSVTAMVQNPLPVLRKYKPDIVIAEGAPSYLTIWLLLFFRYFFKYKLIIWSHGVKFREMNNPFRTISGKLKHYLFNKADSLILYSEDRKEIVAKHIQNPLKLFVAENTLDTNSLTEFYKIQVLRGKENIKKDLQWTNRYNLIFIGRLLKSKGLDTLISVFNSLPDDLDVALHIVGDGPESRSVSLQAIDNPKIHIYGAVYEDEITSKYLFASDLMIMPGYVGLSIVHAFVFGCPIITCIGNATTGPFHSPEIEYLIDGNNGYLLNNNPAEIALKIQHVLADEKCLKQLSKNALDTIRERATLSKMIDGFEQAILYVTNQG